jgi:3-oxoacyl-[acyl-carrier protein] reductase
MFAIEIPSRNAWVTGASRGIGRSIAISLAKAGCQVAVSYHSKQSEADAVVSEIESAGGKAFAMQVDVSKENEVETAYNQIKERFGKIDILVNSAGVVADNLFVMMPTDDWRKVIDTNLMGAVHTCKLVAKDMMSNRYGRIINLSSVAATRGGRGQSNYAASKGAIEAFTRSLAAEIGRRGITVNCVAPGVIETDMSAEVRKLAQEEILKLQIVKRFGSPDEIAAWVVMLASQYGDFITGQVLHIDGGLKMA